MTRTYTCILCPNGCEITAQLAGDAITELKGATCPKGEGYVRQELTNPQRNIATSVLLSGGELPLVSVRLDKPIPKGKIFAAMAEINKLRLEAPTVIGTVVLKNVCGIDSNVIITKNVAKRH